MLSRVPAPPSGAAPLGVEHLEIDIGLARRIGVDRHEIVLAAHLHAVAGIVEQRDVGPCICASEGLHRLVERALVEVELRAAADQRETEPLRVRRDQRGVVAGIVEPRDVPVGRVADHQRHALLGTSGMRQDSCEENHEQQQPFDVETRQLNWMLASVRGDCKLQWVLGSETIPLDSTEAIATRTPLP